MKPLLVLGATGFIGRHVASRAGDREVVTTSRRPGAADLRLDLLDGDALREALRVVRPHAVINCAGAVAGSVSCLVEGNVTTVATLAEVVGDTRVVHLGSSAEYGRVTEGVPITERDEPQPVGAYGVTKLAGTALARRLPNGVVLRVFNPFGPGSPRTSLMGEVATQLGSGETEIRTGDLGAVRDYVDVRDVADAAIAAAEAEVTGVLNIGSGTATLSRDLVTDLVSLVPGRTLAEVRSGSERSAAVPWHRADITAATAALGWKPLYPRTASVGDLWRSWCEEEGC
ncbi:NAD(P)-dependent oxidoreductase [Actinocorallia longicatena]|uniref:NAD(P)-dependent oxidoreductase n=1 Tax=Actinocorallia longicatena TaxID=111803 RepID=A0ABP6QK85_9ACTN